MRVVILGRDGVINECSAASIKSVDEWRPLPGSLEAIARLTQAHYHVVIMTNQPGVARGLFDLTALHQIHAHLQKELARRGGRVDAIYYCPHDDGDECPCRKPKAGMIRDLAKRLQLDLAGVTVIGDSSSDLQVARAVKARSMLLCTGEGRRLVQQAKASGDDLDGVEVFDDLAAAVDQLLSEMD